MLVTERSEVEKRDTHNASAAAVLPRAADKATLVMGLGPLWASGCSHS